MRYNWLLVVCLIMFTAFASYGQYDRKKAKFMDTCQVNLLTPETIYKSESPDSTNLFLFSCNCELPKYDLRVFDRWGTNIVISKNIKDTIELNELKTGTYVWVLDAEYPNGKNDILKGAITIKDP